MFSRFLHYVGFVLYGVFSFPFYVVRQTYRNYVYDREYRSAFTKGKKAFNTPDKVFRLIQPKQTISDIVSHKSR